MQYEEFTQFLGLYNYIINVTPFSVDILSYFKSSCYLLPISANTTYNLLSVTSTHFRSMLHFYIPWKRQKIFGFLTFSGDRNETMGWNGLINLF